MFNASTELLELWGKILCKVSHGVLLSFHATQGIIRLTNNEGSILSWFGQEAPVLGVSFGHFPVWATRPCTHHQIRFHFSQRPHGPILSISKITCGPDHRLGTSNVDNTDPWQMCKFLYASSSFSSLAVWTAPFSYPWKTWYISQKLFSCGVVNFHLNN